MYYLRTVDLGILVSFTRGWRARASLGNKWPQPGAVQRAAHQGAAPRLASASRALGPPDPHASNIPHRSAADVVDDALAHDTVCKHTVCTQYAPSPHAQWSYA